MQTVLIQQVSFGTSWYWYCRLNRDNTKDNWPSTDHQPFKFTAFNQKQSLTGQPFEETPYLCLENVSHQDLFQVVHRTRPTCLFRKAACARIGKALRPFGAFYLHTLWHCFAIAKAFFLMPLGWILRKAATAMTSFELMESVIDIQWPLKYSANRRDISTFPLLKCHRDGDLEILLQRLRWQLAPLRQSGRRLHGIGPGLGSLEITTTSGSAYPLVMTFTVSHGKIHHFIAR